MGELRRLDDDARRVRVEMLAGRVDAGEAGDRADPDDALRIAEEGVLIGLPAGEAVFGGERLDRVVRAEAVDAARSADPHRAAMVLADEEDVAIRQAGAEVEPLAVGAEPAEAAGTADPQAAPTVLEQLVHVRHGERPRRIGNRQQPLAVARHQALPERDPHATGPPLGDVPRRGERRAVWLAVEHPPAPVEGTHRETAAGACRGHPQASRGVDLGVPVLVVRKRCGRIAGFEPRGARRAALECRVGLQPERAIGRARGLVDPFVDQALRSPQHLDDAGLSTQRQAGGAAQRAEPERAVGARMDAEDAGRRQALALAEAGLGEGTAPRQPADFGAHPDVLFAVLEGEVHDVRRQTAVGRPVLERSSVRPQQEEAGVAGRDVERSGGCDGQTVDQARRELVLGYRGPDSRRAPPPAGGGGAEPERVAGPRQRAAADPQPWGGRLAADAEVC